MVARNFNTVNGIRHEVSKADLCEAAEVRRGIITAAMGSLGRELDPRPGGFRMLNRRLMGGPYYVIGNRVYAVGRDWEVRLSRTSINRQDVLNAHIVYAIGFYRRRPNTRRSTSLPQRLDIEQLSLITADKVREFWSDPMTGGLAQYSFGAKVVERRIHMAVVS